MTEFELIHTYFRRNQHGPSVVIGNGDDGAVFTPTPGMHTVVSVDSVVAGRHVPTRCPPEGFASRLLGRGLSDLAAMGASPRYVLLSLTLPSFDAAWIDAFAEKFYHLAVQWGVDLIGGDTTRGPLAAQVTVLGEVPVGGAVTRAGAEAGDRLWLLGGDLGGARAYLEVLSGSVSEHPAWAERYWRPEPLLALGESLRGQVHALIDISDGLCQDLGHLMSAASAPLAARLDSHAVPMAPGIEDRFGRTRALEMALTGGDDYVLLAAVAPDIELTEGTCIGMCEASDIRTLTLDGAPLPEQWQWGWDHSR